MNLPILIREYFLSQRQEARLTLSGVGTFSTKSHRGYKGRNPYTGETVEVPETYSLLFSETDQSGTNDHFIQWATRHSGTNETVQQDMLKFSEEIVSTLDKARKFVLNGVGSLLLKNRPPLYGVNRLTGDFIEVPARSALVFSVLPEFNSELNPASRSARIDFDKLPQTPVKTPDGLSSFALEQLPSARQLWKLSQTLAVLSLCNNDPGRYFSVPSLRPGLNYAEMRNGQGDNCSLFFFDDNALIRGFAHESPMATWSGEAWPGTFDTLPQDYRDLLFHDFLEAESISFCLWYSDSSKQWNKGNITRFPDVPSDDPDGSAYVLSHFPLEPQTYVESESHYYSRQLNFEIVAHIYEHRPLSLEQIKKLNPDCRVPLEMFRRTGFPIEDVK